MKLVDIYTRIVETTGLDVITLDNLRTAIKNCLADLTSRGYKTFVEKHLEDLQDIERYPNEIIFTKPKNVAKHLYVRIYFNRGEGCTCDRKSISDPRIGSLYDGKIFTSVLKPRDAIYYTKNDKVYIEWDERMGKVVEVQYAYYERLSMPEDFPTDVNDLSAMQTCDINIREEYEDAIVFYAAYFYYARFIKDQDKVQAYLSQYKYFIEDITHELAYEDEFNEGTAVIIPDD